MNIENIIYKKIKESNLSNTDKDKVLNDSTIIICELLKRQKNINPYLIDKIVQRRIENLENIA